MLIAVENMLFSVGVFRQVFHLGLSTAFLLLLELELVNFTGALGIGYSYTYTLLLTKSMLEVGREN